MRHVVMMLNLRVSVCVFQVQGKVRSKDSKSFKEGQQWCDTCCYRHALCPYVCKYMLNIKL